MGSNLRSGLNGEKNPGHYFEFKNKNTYAQSLRSKILPRSIKKNHQFSSKNKKVRAFSSQAVEIFKNLETPLL